jgi:hypothetical protein
MEERLREGMANDYQDFLDEYLLGSSRMVEAAERGYRLDPRLCLPTGSQPPMLADTILSPNAGPRRSSENLQLWPVQRIAKSLLDLDNLAWLENADEIG